MSGDEVLVAASDALRAPTPAGAHQLLDDTGFELTPALARALAPRRRELICPECGERCERSDIPEDQDPWCICGTLMEPGC